MPRYSTKTLLLAVLLFCGLLATLCVPRARFNKSSAERLHDGMSLKECTRVLGVQPGWYDGIQMCSGLPLGNKMQRTADWINLQGAIVVDEDLGRISNIRVFRSSEFRTGYNFGGMIYDRTVMRLFGSHSSLASAAILVLGILASFLPALLVARFSKLKLTEIFWFGSIVVAIVFIGFGTLSQSWWMSHHEQSFADRQMLMFLAGVISTSGLCLKRVLSQNLASDMQSRHNKSMHRSGLRVFARYRSL